MRHAINKLFKYNERLILNEMSQAECIAWVCVMSVLWAGFMAVLWLVSK